MEFCQWLMDEKGIEAGNLSDYINNNEEEVLKLAEEFKKPKFKLGGKIEAAAEMFKCGGKAKKKKVKKAQGGEKLGPISVNLGNNRHGEVTIYPDSRVERIYGSPDVYGRGISSPGGNITDREIIGRDTVMFSHAGPSGVNILYDTRQKPTGKEAARQNANKRKFNPMFDEMARMADNRIDVLPDGKHVIHDIVHTNNDTLSRIIDQGDTTIVNSAGDRLRNNSIRTRLARMLFGTSNYDELNKNFKDIDFQQDGGELLNRKDLKKEAKENYGYNGKHFRDAYRNSIAAYQNKGYKRSKAKEFAQDILTRTPEIATSVPIIGNIESPINPVIKGPSDINMPVNKFSTVVSGKYSNTSDYDSMSFNSAFGAARKSGDKTFWWRGREYGTELAKDIKPKAAKVDFNKVELEPMEINIVPVRKVNEKPAPMFDSEGLPIGYEIPGGYNDIESFKFFNYPDSTIVTKDHGTRYRLHKSGDDWVGFEEVAPDSLVYSNIDDESKVDSLLRRYRAVTNRIIDKNKVL